MAVEHTKKNLGARFRQETAPVTGKRYTVARIKTRMTLVVLSREARVTRCQIVRAS